VLELAVHRVRKDPAQHVDVCEAAAQAVVTLLDRAWEGGPVPSDLPEDAPEPEGFLVGRPAGPWADAVAYWRSGWIRKVVRRAENKRWDDVQALDGVTATVAHEDSAPAEVRAFVPGPLRPLPAELGKLQVGGTEFPRDRGSLSDDALVLVELSPLAPMSSGKSAAQAGHAAQLLYEQLDEDRRAAWREDGFRVRVALPTAQEWADAPRDVAVVDAGLTELDGPTETARARWDGK
jgi:hypothetical protein